MIYHTHICVYGEWKRAPSRELKVSALLAEVSKVFTFITQVEV